MRSTLRYAAAFAALVGAQAGCNVRHVVGAIDAGDGPSVPAGTGGGAGQTAACRPGDPTLSLLAGSLGGSNGDPGIIEGVTGFAPAQGLASDGAGNLYVAVNEAVLRMNTATGEITTLAGAIGISGQMDGVGPAARFHQPTELAYDDAGNLFVRDLEAVRKVVLATGEVTTLPVAIEDLAGMASDRAGNLLLSYPQTILKMDLATGATNPLLGTGRTWNRPGAMAFDDAGNLFVADDGVYIVLKTTGKAVLVTSVRSATHLARGTDGEMFASGGSHVYVVYGQWGAGVDIANVVAAGGLASDGAGSVYFTDEGRVRHLVRGTEYGRIVTVPGFRPLPAPRIEGLLDMTADRAGNLLALDESSGFIKIAVPTGELSMVADPYLTEIGQTTYNGGLTSDGRGNIYFTIPGGLTYFAIDADAMVPAHPPIRHSSPLVNISGRVGPGAITSDHAGNLYTHSYDSWIVQVSQSTGAITTVPGSRSQELGMAADAGGIVYFTEKQTIRRAVVATGEVTTLAGGYGLGGTVDGVGTNARFLFPRRLASDHAGTLYAVDGRTIRKIVVATGQVTTLAGHPDDTEFVLGCPASLGDVNLLAALPNGQVALASGTAVLLLK
jgi:hypothetical protein